MSLMRELLSLQNLTVFECLSKKDKKYHVIIYNDQLLACPLKRVYAIIKNPTYSK